jgi:hypothetical protein
MIPIGPSSRPIENHNVGSRPCATLQFPDPLLYEGDKVTVEGITIEVLMHGNYDRIRITKP